MSNSIENRTEGFVKIRRGLTEHLWTGKLSPLELAAYVMLHLRADFETGICETCAETLAHWMGEGKQVRRYQGLLWRLRKKRYINYRAGDGRRRAYPILIHKYEPTVPPWFGYRLDAWKHGHLCEAEYVPVGSDTPESRLTAGGERADSVPNKEIRIKKQDKSKAAALETKMRMRRREALTDEEVATFEVPERLMWALERRQRIEEAIKRAPVLAAGYANEIRQTESLAAAIFQQSSTEQLHAIRKTHIAATGRCCPPSLVDELEKRGVKVDRFVRRIEACDTRARRRRKKPRAAKRLSARRSRARGTRTRRPASRTIQ